MEISNMRNRAPFFPGNDLGTQMEVVPRVEYRIVLPQWPRQDCEDAEISFPPAFLLTGTMSGWPTGPELGE
jgi:hypothetical protein